MRKFLARFRQSPVFSTVYVLGSALSVASVMLVAIFLHVKTSNIYPEYSRDKTLQLNKIDVQYTFADTVRAEVYGEELKEETRHSSGGLSAKHAAMLRDTLRHTCDVAICGVDPRMVSVYVDNKRNDNILMREADSGLFNVYNYKFIDGKPFTKEDVESKAAKVVISDKLARKLFGTDKEIIGREMVISNLKLGFFGRMNQEETAVRVCGVFKEGSRLLPYSFAEIIFPSISETIDFSADIVGENKLIMVPKAGVTPEQVSETIKTFFAKYVSSTPLTIFSESWYEKWVDDAGITHLNGHWASGPQYAHPVAYGNYTVSMGTYPRGNLQMMLGNPSDLDEEFNFIGITKLYGILILVLLLVPALNLSSLISGNMDSKLSEMGIRKAFGAKNSTLLRQVLNENLWLTACGALLGIVFSWIGVVLWKDWLFAGVGTGEGGALVDYSTTFRDKIFGGAKVAFSNADFMLDPAMLFAPAVFIAAVAICFTLNLLSTLIPAWWALRRPAIDSIKAKS